VNGRLRPDRLDAAPVAVQASISAYGFGGSLTVVNARPRLRVNRGWIVYALGWVALALLWSLAAALSSGMSPRFTSQFGFLMMGTAGIMGVAVWWLTGRLPWDRRSIAFYAAHACSAALYSVSYTIAACLSDFVEGKFVAALASQWSSPVLGWNIFMGSLLYLVVAGLSYGIRTQQRLNRQAAAEAEARVLAERAQLAALRARLNPHFLFNALHTVSSLVATDPEAADEAIERLGGLLRYALDESTDEIPLEREWAFTRDYLAFDRLRVCEALDQDALAAEVPLLVLQPLVENAVRHAIDPRDEGGTIRVTAGVRNRVLTLRVEDDGPGAVSENVEPGHGLGLRALKRRLEVRYGGDARVEIHTAPGAGFTVTVALPAKSLVSAGAA
jgi:signal transduction histidine kinase